MRKIIASVLVLALALVMLTGCGIMAMPINIALGLMFPESYNTAPSYEGERKSFSYSGLEIVLTDAFEPSFEYEDVGYYDADDGTSVAVERLSYGALEIERGCTDLECADAVRRSITELYGGDSTVRFECTDVGLVENIASFSYTLSFIASVDTLVFVYPTADSVFAVSITPPVGKTETYRPYMIEWASSVSYNNANTAA